MAFCIEKPDSTGAPINAACGIPTIGRSACLDRSKIYPSTGAPSIEALCCAAAVTEIAKVAVKAKFNFMGISLTCKHSHVGGTDRQGNPRLCRLRPLMHRSSRGCWIYGTRGKRRGGVRLPVGNIHLREPRCRQLGH